MVSRDLVAAKLADLADRIARVRDRRPADVEGLQTDRDALDLVAFNLMLSVQICADIASHIIADEGWPPAGSLADGFQRLRDQGVLSAETSGALARAVGLRNVVAHGYQRVDVRSVFAGATTGLSDLQAFAEEVSRWVLGRSQSST